MKKKWVVLTLLILLGQYFSPLIALAEENVAAPEISNQFELGEVTSDKTELKGDEGMTLTINGATTTATPYSQTLNLSSLLLTSSVSGDLINGESGVIGNYQGSGSQITLNFTKVQTLPTSFTLQVGANLLDQTTPNQTIGVSAGQVMRTSNVTLIGEEPTDTPETETITEEPTEAEEDGEVDPAKETEESLETPEKIETAPDAAKAKAEREPVNINQFFAEIKPTQFFTSFKMFDGNGVEIQDGTPIKIGDPINFDFTFELPESIRKQMIAGDFYEAQLPAELKIITPINQPLIGKSGEYGRLTIDTDGKMKIIFNEKVNEESNIHGTIEVGGKLQQGDNPNPGEGTIEFPFIEGEPGKPIIITPETAKDISKKGHPNSTANPNELIWEVDINMGMNKLTDATVTEAFPAGTSYKSVKVYQLKVGFDGKPIEGSESLVQPPVYSVDADGNVTFPGEITNAYRIEYTTKIDKMPADEGGEPTFVNNATLTAKELPEGSKASASIKTYYHPKLEKKKPVYDKNKQEFHWTVNYNFNETNIPAGSASVKDTFTGGKMILLDESVVINKVTFDDNAQPIEGEALVAGRDYDLLPNPDGDGFVVEFRDGLDYAVTLHYTTKITEEVNSTQKYNNAIIDGEGHESGNNGTAQQQGIIKNVADVDYQAKTITWEIQVNNNNYELNNWSMIDTLSPGLTLRFPDGRGFIIQNKTKGGTLDPGVDYTFKYTAGDKKSQDMIEIHFIGDYAKTTDSFNIIYATKFDTAALNEAGLEVFKNEATSHWISKEGTESSANDWEDFKPSDEESADGFKNGRYNALTKEITWEIGFNYNRQKLGDVTIKDPITSNQKYVPGSLKVYRYTIGKDGKITRGEEVPVGIYTFTEPTEGKNELVVNFANVGPNDQYVYDFRTSLEGEMVNEAKEYTNVATASASEVEGDYRIEGKVSIANAGQLISKDGNQGKDGYLHWSAVINASQSTIYEAIVRDKPSTNQSIDLNSVILYDAEVNAAGKLTKGAETPKDQYEVTLTTDNVTGQQELVVKFLAEKIERAYFLDYSAMLMLENPTGEVATNHITLEGKNKETVGDEHDGKVEVEASTGGGTAVGELGQITLQKVDGADTSKVLTGATFEIWNEKNTQKLREGTIGKEGTLTMGRLPHGNYLLKETKAPTGYTIPKDLLTGRKIKIDKTTSSAGHLVQIKNDQTEVKLIKEGPKGERLAGAQFRVQRYALQLWVPLPGNPVFTTNEKGELSVRGLNAGKYRFTEILSPDGYIRTSEPIEFEVERQANGQINTVTVGPVVNYLGSASLIKTDSKTKAVLAGAEFEAKRVKDASGGPTTDLPVKATAGADGKVLFENLKTGDYVVTETKAAPGYLLNTETLEFTVKNDPVNPTTGFVTLELGDFDNYQGSVSLIKKAADKAGKPTTALAGAEFKIESADKTMVKTATSAADGEVLFEGLAPGDYNVTETKAAPGYILNTEVVKVVVPKEAKGEPAVVEIGNFLNYKGSAKLTKVNTKGETLANAEFTLYLVSDKEQDNPLGVFTTGDAGLIEIDDLAPGKYKLIETQAPVQADGTSYIKNLYPVFFNILDANEGPVKVLNLGDYQNFTGRAVINKKSAEGPAGQDLSGAEFDLYQIVNGEEIKNEIFSPLVSQTDGSLILDGLGAGSYKLVETKALEGHVINKQPIYITVEDLSGGNPTNDDPFDYNNYEQVIKFVKKDEAGKLISGATFNIYAIDDLTTPINDEPFTDTNGAYEFKGIEIGEYILREMTPAPGYLKNTADLKFEVEPQIGAPEEIVLADFINYQGEATLIKVAEDGTTLAGAEFEIFDSNKESKGKATSDADGLVTFKDLAPGVYTIEEKKAPAGYFLNTTVIEDVTIDAEAAGKPKAYEVGQFTNYKGSVSFIKVDALGAPLPGAVFTLDNGDTATADVDGVVTFTDLAPGDYVAEETVAADGYIVNETKIPFTIKDKAAGQPEVIQLEDFKNYQGEAFLVKVSEDGQALDGAEFTLYDSEGNAVGEPVTSDKAGVVRFTDLAPGSYTVEETKAPTGYLINTNTEKFAFEIVAKHEGELPVKELGNFKNYQGEVTLLKLDELGDVLPGAEFTLYDSKGNEVGTPVTSDDAGLVSFKKLAPGDYTIKETKAPDGYILNETVLAFTIAASADEQPAIVELDEFVNFNGSLAFNKTDEAGKGLQGAEFTLYNEKGEETVTVSDETGKVSFNKLAPGKYTLKETKAAPGYLLNTAEVKVEIVASYLPTAENPTVPTQLLADFINYQGTATLTKVDAKDKGKVLADAEFKLVDSKGKAVREKLVTDADGLISVKDLAPGTYYFVETKAPQGYELSKEKVEVLIVATAENKPATVEVSMTNMLLPDKPTEPGQPGKDGQSGQPGKNNLPKAGSEANSFLLLIGLLMTGFVLYFLESRRHIPKYKE